MGQFVRQKIHSIEQNRFKGSCVGIRKAMGLSVLDFGRYLEFRLQTAAGDQT